jgi:di/tricarboxylate transporter
VGWALIGLAGVIALQHLIHHFGAFTLISNGWDDLAAGYPLAALLGVIGTVILSTPVRTRARR